MESFFRVGKIIYTDAARDILSHMTVTAEGEVKKEGSWFLNALGEVGSFIGRLVTNFLRLFFSGLGFSVLIAIVVYFAAGGEQLWKGWLGAAITLIGGGVLSFFSATKLSIVLALADTVRAK